MGTSDIEWTEVTWNPTVGCAKVSEGCRHCYAMRMAHRLGHNPKVGDVYQGLTKPSSSGPQWTRTVRVLPERLGQPLGWRKPRLIFVNSMSDLFHEEIPETFVTAVFAVMAAAGGHTYQVLTKRPEHLQAWSAMVPTSADARRRWLLEAVEVHQPALAADLRRVAALGRVWPLPNVWLGTSVESREHVDRIGLLREVSAAVRFLSLEPLLGPLPGLDLSAIHWVIVGGESGPRARAMDPSWVLDLRAQCEAAEVSFFFKQWGGVRKGTAGRLLEGRTWDEMPAVGV